ncbi:MAG TPA: 2-oxo acid dehydrogenase subunit E2, partial [Gemmatimonadaceae bacterium]|nr:2-oxo acid dehydrogenase subunit E2 [Gemmatimonadaceae bacterium]
MIAIKVPPLGESIVEATISRWLKQEGEAVAAGDTLVELETDKVTVEVPAMKAGVLTKRHKQEGDVVAVDDTLGELDETATGAAAGAAASAAPGAAAPAAAAPAPPAAATPAPNAEAPPPPPQAGSGVGFDTPRVAPAAQRAADERGIDVNTVSGSGRGGVISKPDVIEQGGLAAAATPSAQAAQVAPPAAPVPAAPSVDVVRPDAPRAFAAAPGDVTGGPRETREKMTTRRRRIAEHLLESQHATAHLTTFNEVDMSAVEALRGRLRDRVEKEHGIRLSFMPFFVKAAVMALEQYPVVNAQVDGDSIVYRHYVNMGIAVASPGGLVVPNVKDAQAKGMLQVSRDIVDIAKRARDGKLNMDDLTGGTFTITNGGVFGSLVSTPIINFPQAAILGL